MYSVSNAYKEAMKRNVQSFKITGTIGNVSFTENDILMGSLNITNQCSGSENIEIGQVYIGELNCTFMDVNIERNSWFGKIITINFGQKLANNSYEYIPLGVFTVSEANYTESGIVVKAYDNMAKLDKKCSALGTGATPYNLAKSMCKECGVTLETTEGTFTRFPNGRTTLGFFAENDINTYRDAISWIAQTCCCIVTASRTGGIIFKNYSSEAVDTIDDYHRFTGCSFSDFSTRYTGISVVNMEEQTTSYYAVSPDDALTYNLGSNPYLQVEVSHSQTTMRKNVLNKLAEIDFVPFKATCIGNPAYDVGDTLIFSGGIADATKKSVITKYSWTYGRDYVMEGVGKNPALATGNSKSDKNIAGLISQTSDELYRVTVLRNGDAVAITDGHRESVIFARYLLASPSHVRFNFEVLLTVTSTTPTENLAEVTITGNTLTLTPTPTPSFTTVKAIYKSDAQEITTRYPIETWQSGKHILTLQYDLDMEDSLSHSFELLLEVEGGSVTIGVEDAYMVISSTGLAADSNWEGIFRAEDGNLYIVINGQAYKIPDSITVGHYPNKMTYETDEPIDYPGLIIHAVYGDGTRVPITAECDIDPASGIPFDPNADDHVEVKWRPTIAGQEISEDRLPISYETGFDLTHNYVTNLIITPPTKDTYRYNEIIDYTGLSIIAEYRDGTTADVTNSVTIKPAEGSHFDYNSF